MKLAYHELYSKPCEVLTILMDNWLERKKESNP
jgi:hypothetical protein